jgi:acyl carrier protein
MDFLDFYEMISDVEKKYTRKISAETAKKLTTVNRRTNYVMEKTEM